MIPFFHLFNPSPRFLSHRSTLLYSKNFKVKGYLCDRCFQNFLLSTDFMDFKDYQPCRLINF